MTKRLQLLESTAMQGDDGQRYTVRAYEHVEALDWDPAARMEPTGVIEYKLEDGRRVNVDRGGRMTVADTGVALKASAPGKKRIRAARGLPEHARP